MLVPDNEHYTQQKRLIFSPPKPPFRCKVTPSTLHLLYVAGGDPGGVRGGGKNIGAVVVPNFQQPRENYRRGAVQALPQSRRGRFLSRFSPRFWGVISAVFRPVLKLPPVCGKGGAGLCRGWGGAFSDRRGLNSCPLRMSDN